MNVFVVAVFGAVIGSMCASVSQLLGIAIDATWRMSPRTRIAALVIGGATGTAVRGMAFHEAVAVSGLAALLIVQAPIDFVFRRLARAPTILATVFFQGVQLAKVTEVGWWDGWWKSNITVLSITVVFSITHRVSKESLGWGDVLLVIPTGMAVALSEVSLVMRWLLLASLTTSLHGVAIRLRGRRFIPFGPHLLFAAWFVSIIEV